jgi:hypothetical protein
VRWQADHVLLAHALTESAALGVPPALVAVVVAAAAAAAAGRGAASIRPAAEGPGAPATGARLDVDLRTRLAGPLGRRAVVGRAVGAGLLLLAVVAGRVGPDDQLLVITTALVVGVGWPLLLAATAVAGDVWGWLQPLDALARPLEGAAGGEEAVDAPPGDRLAWIAVVGALGLSWWLAMWLPGLQPRALALGLGAYAIASLAGCLAVGRARWLSTAEVLTVALGAVAAARRGAVPLAHPHAVALAVLAAGLTAAEVRQSRWWVEDVQRLGLRPFDAPAAVLAYALVVGLGVAAALGALRWARRRGSPGTVEAVLAWLLVGAGLSAAWERDRLWTSAQLLVSRISDPLGTGADLFGTAGREVLLWPYGGASRLVVQLLLLVVPVLVGALLVRRRATGPTEPAAALAAGWLLLASLSVGTGTA